MDGLLIQWGTQKSTANQQSTIYFNNISFSNANSYYVEFITHYDKNDAYYKHSVSKTSGSSCTVYDYNIYTSSNFDWIAIGY